MINQSLLALFEWHFINLFLGNLKIFLGEDLRTYLKEEKK